MYQEKQSPPAASAAWFLPFPPTNENNNEDAENDENCIDGDNNEEVSCDRGNDEKCSDDEDEDNSDFGDAKGDGCGDEDAVKRSGDTDGGKGGSCKNSGNIDNSNTNYNNNHSGDDDSDDDNDGDDGARAGGDTNNKGKISNGGGGGLCSETASGNSNNVRAAEGSTGEAISAALHLTASSWNHRTLMDLVAGLGCSKEFIRHKFGSPIVSAPGMAAANKIANKPDTQARETEKTKAENPIKGMDIISGSPPKKEKLEGTCHHKTHHNAPMELGVHVPSETLPTGISIKQHNQERQRHGRNKRNLLSLIKQDSHTRDLAQPPTPDSGRGASKRERSRKWRGKLFLSLSGEDSDTDGENQSRDGRKMAASLLACSPPPINSTRKVTPTDKATKDRAAHRADRGACWDSCSAKEAGPHPKRHLGGFSSSEDEGNECEDGIDFLLTRNCKRRRLFRGHRS